MIAAHIDEPRRLLLEAETHGHLWSWVVNLHSNFVSFGIILRRARSSVFQWDMSRNWGSSLPRHEWGSRLVGLVEGPSIGTCSFRRWSWLFTQQALVRVIGNSKCCQQFLGGREYRVLDKAHSHWTCSTNTIPHHLQNNFNSRHLKIN